ncbi:MAG: Zn-ribbon domain-containing OB-fold protein [Desulfurococcaceae archaeon]
MKGIIPPFWRTRVHRYRLVASKCRACGRTLYPPADKCRSCGSREIEYIELIHERAKLITWTVIYNAMDGFEDRKPVVLGLLETVNTKARIVAPLTDVLLAELSIGMLMEPVIRKVSSDGEHGLIYYGIAYRPTL